MLNALVFFGDGLETKLTFSLSLIFLIFLIKYVKFSLIKKIRIFVKFFMHQKANIYTDLWRLGNLVIQKRIVFNKNAGFYAVGVSRK